MASHCGPPGLFEKWVSITLHPLTSECKTDKESNWHRRIMYMSCRHLDYIDTLAVNVLPGRNMKSIVLAGKKLIPVQNATQTHWFCMAWKRKAL